MMTKKDLNKLKKSLPKGYSDLISERLNCTTSLVNMVFSGTRKNLKVIKEAIEIAKVHKEEMDKLSKEIQEL